MRGDATVCRGRKIFLGALLLCASTITATAQTFTTLVDFDGTNGASSQTPLIQGLDGSLYGATSQGGSSTCPHGCGTAFKITPTGQLITLHEFGLNVDGAEPLGTLVQATDGNIYGTASIGGPNYAKGKGSGTFFKITPAGKFSVLYNFCSEVNCEDGGDPEGGLIQAAGGDFYGTTSLGGAYGYGSIFRITSAGKLTTLHSFCSSGYICQDGSTVQAGLLQGIYGDLYGVTGDGGLAESGTVFKITTGGTFTSLHSFCFGTCSDGAEPLGSLVQAPDLNL